MFRSHALASLLSVASLALFGCRHGPSPSDMGADLGPQDTTPVVLGSGSYRLDVRPVDGRAGVLPSGDGATERLGLGGFLLGTVPALDPKKAYDPYWYEPREGFDAQPLPDGFAWRTPRSAEVTRRTDDELELALDYGDGLTARLDYQVTADGSYSGLLAVTATPENEAVAMMRLVADVSSDEGFYGLGEWGDAVNHRGKLRPMQLEPDFGAENASDENHVPVPLLIGTRGWGLFVESHRVGAFDVARKHDDQVEITYGTADQSGDGLRFHLLAADHPLDVTRLYYDLTGYPMLPAEWALGPWFWRNDTSGQAEVEDDIAKLRDLDLATSAMWIDRPYATAVNTFDFAPADYDDPKAMIDRAHDMGLRMAVWHTPYLEPAAQPYRAEAEQKGYFVAKPGTILNKWSTPIDFTNPDAYSWWQSLIKKYSDLGIEGYKLDFGEDVVASISDNRTNWMFFDGSTERTMHYGYVTLYHRVYAETLPSTGGYLLCRTGRWGDQVRVSVIWPGDLDASFTQKDETYKIAGPGGKTVNRGVGGLPAAIADGLSLGPSGFPFFGSDTGGYLHSPPNKELFLRWVEHTSLSTVMNVGDGSSQAPWEYNTQNGRDDEALAVYRRYARLHMRLFPYVWTYAQDLKKDGRPIARPLGLAYPELGAHPSDTYLLGDNLLVAPVITAGATTREVTLPPGDWIDWWDGTVHHSAGTQTTIDAPLDKLPLLLRAGGIVPMLRPTIDAIAPTTQPGTDDGRVDSYGNDAGVLWVRAFPAAPGDFTVFDGGALHVEPGRTSFQAGTKFTQGVVIELMNVARPTSVSDGSAVAEADSLDALAQASDVEWFWEATNGGTLWLRLAGGQHDVSYQ